MAEFKLSEDINRSPNELFEFLVTPKNISALVQTIKIIEKISDGPLAKGTVYRQVSRHRGQEYESFVEVTEFERPSLYELSVTDKDLGASYTYSLIPRDKGSRITLYAQIIGEGFLRPMAWIVAQKMKQRDGAILKKIKAMIEEPGLENQ